MTDADKQPQHVAIVMDGNGRWAKKRFLPRYAGHRAGLEAIRKTIRVCLDKHIPVLTLFAFSSENWQRPAKEVNVLMDLLLSALQTEVNKLDKHHVCLRFIGDIEKFSPKLQQHIKNAQAQTTQNKAMTLNIAANYGGQWDILQAVKKIAWQVEEGQKSAASISATNFRQALSLADLPDPDLFIRTGGEQRISNFLLWQLAYAELYFTDVLWPDFDANAFEQALNAFAHRQRRFGQTGEQVS
jgi:undecaprenyl diphosphate synthase